MENHDWRNKRKYDVNARTENKNIEKEIFFSIMCCRSKHEKEIFLIEILVLKSEMTKIKTYSKSTTAALNWEKKE